MSRVLATPLLYVLLATPSFAQDEPPLLRLTNQAMSPRMAFKKGVLGPTGRETNLKGWLVLNGARFANSEYPVLAKILKEAYAQHGYSDPDPNFTRLQAFPTEKDAHGTIVRGMAICPSPALCGELTAEVAPFDLNSGL
jgi:hypothetical protein